MVSRARRRKYTEGQRALLKFIKKGRRLRNRVTTATPDTDLDLARYLDARDGGKLVAAVKDGE